MKASSADFCATVSAIRELARVDGRQVWQIALDRTTFRPGNAGVLTATARSGAVLHVPVSAVEIDVAGEVWHTAHKPLQEGTGVEGWVQQDGGVHPSHS